jgi:hypothetical protein
VREQSSDVKLMKFKQDFWSFKRSREIWSLF